MLIFDKKEFLFLCLLVLVIFSLSIETPLLGEDFALSNHWWGLNDFNFVLKKQIDQMVTWNARLGESLAVYLLWLPRVCVSVIMLISLFITITLLMQIAEIKLTTKNWVICLVSFLTFFPSFDLIFWRTLLANYFIPINFVLAEFFYYWIVLKNDDKVSNLKIALFTFIGFLAGLSFENTLPAITILAFVSYYKFRDKHQMRCFIFPLLFVFIGFLLLYFAPSTAVRVEYYQQAYGFEGYSVQYFYTRFIDSLIAVVLFVYPVLVPAILILVFKRYTQYLILIFASLGTFLPLFFSPYTEGRSMLALALIAYVPIFKFVTVCEVKFCRLFLWGTAIITVAVCACSCLPIYEKISERNASIANDLLHGEGSEVVTYAFTELKKNRFLREIFARL